MKKITLSLKEVFRFYPIILKRKIKLLLSHASIFPTYFKLFLLVDIHLQNKPQQLYYIISFTGNYGRQFPSSFEKVCVLYFP